MALQTIPGFTGFQYARLSSMDKRAIGKFTDTNHLYSLHSTDPVDYDKKIIQIYSQSSLFANDFLNMINESDPFYIDQGESWKWKIEVPFSFSKIVDVPVATLSDPKPGIDGHELTLVLDTNEFSKNETFIIGNRMYGPQLAVVKDPQVHGRAFLYTVTLLSDNPTVDFVDSRFLKVGMEIHPGTSTIGEFDVDLPGLGRMADTIEMYETLGSASGRSHKITKWADASNISQRDSSGLMKDLLVYAPQVRNSTSTMTVNDVRWEPFIEAQLRQKMLTDKVNKMIWQKAGTVRTNGAKQEYKRLSDGVYQRMRKHGNYVPFERGTFSNNLIRTVFGDLFYRRVDMSKRRVKLYTNEAGMDIFQTAIKQDAINSGLTIVAGVNDKFIQGSGQHLTYNWAFDSMVSRETGVVEVIHLKELDLPQTQLEMGQNKKSTPVFMVFNVSPDSDGTFRGNVREVRQKGAPSMTWGYIDGRIHHLGHLASKGMTSSSMDPWYTLWFEDRYDTFVEDLSACVLLEEIPQF
jgi:hypothetical protein